jgi:hypothetical protein
MSKPTDKPTFPYRHEATGRTVAYHDAAGRPFTATGVPAGDDAPPSEPATPAAATTTTTKN